MPGQLPQWGWGGWWWVIQTVTKFMESYISWPSFYQFLAYNRVVFGYCPKWGSDIHVKISFGILSVRKYFRKYFQFHNTWRPRRKNLCSQWPIFGLEENNFSVQKYLEYEKFWSPKRFGVRKVLVSKKWYEFVWYLQVLASWWKSWRHVAHGYDCHNWISCPNISHYTKFQLHLTLFDTSLTTCHFSMNN